MAVAALIASTAVSAAASIFGGVTAMNQANYQAEVAKMNQEIAYQNAKRSIDRAQVEQQSQDAISLAMIGEQEAAIGASGLSPTGRSFRGVRQNARTLARLDALNIRQAGELEAYGHRTEAVNFGAAATAAKAEGRAALLGSFLEAGGSILSGASKVRNRNGSGSIAY